MEVEWTVMRSEKPEDGAGAYNIYRDHTKVGYLNIEARYVEEYFRHFKDQAAEIKRLQTQDTVARALVGPLVEDLRREVECLRSGLLKLCACGVRFIKARHGISKSDPMSHSPICPYRIGCGIDHE